MLAWELWDFVPPDRLNEFGQEIRRLLADKGWLLMLSQGAARREDESYGQLCRYRLLADDRIGITCMAFAFDERGVRQDDIDTGIAVVTEPTGLSQVGRSRMIFPLREST